MNSLPERRRGSPPGQCPPARSARRGARCAVHRRPLPRPGCDAGAKRRSAHGAGRRRAVEARSPRYIPVSSESLELFKTLFSSEMGNALPFYPRWRARVGQEPPRPRARRGVQVCQDRVRTHLARVRHTYASHLVQAGVDLLTISKLLGHADTPITSRYYAHLADKTLAARVTKLPSFTAKECSASALVRNGQAR